ncbi:MAG: hypothetical protein H6607_07640 [Flavobacteriales bacterium]|nr:hypothetical protein [Flavobacteriales bacterium]
MSRFDLKNLGVAFILGILDLITSCKVPAQDGQEELNHCSNVDSVVTVAVKDSNTLFLNGMGFPLSENINSFLKDTSYDYFVDEYGARTITIGCSAKDSFLIESTFTGIYYPDSLNQKNKNRGLLVSDTMHRVMESSLHFFVSGLGYQLERQNSVTSWPFKTLNIMLLRKDSLYMIYLRLVYLPFDYNYTYIGTDSCFANETYDYLISSWMGAKELGWNKD